MGFGFARNEARAYTCLVSCEPATAYELAKQSGIPTSKIYETVNKLVEKGVIQLLAEEERSVQRYKAMNPEDLLQQLRDHAVEQTGLLEPMLNSLHRPVDSDLIWPMQTIESVINKSRQLIMSATRELVISLWPQELELLESALLHAEAKGIKIALVHFGPPDRVIGATYHHPVEKTLYQEKGGRGLSLVVDSTIVVIANFLQDGSVDGAWSRNQTFVTVAEDYVKHDVYITKVTRFLEPEVKARFGEDYEKLRDIFNSEA